MGKSSACQTVLLMQRLNLYKQGWGEKQQLMHLFSQIPKSVIDLMGGCHPVQLPMLEVSMRL